MTTVQSSSVITKLRDWNGTESQVTVQGVWVDPAAYDRSEQEALLTAIAGITRGVIVDTQYVAQRDVMDPPGAPADEDAETWNRWKVVYRDTVNNNQYTLTIPTADPSGRKVAGSNQADTANAEVAAFITAFEDYALSPENNPVTVLEIIHVGRRGE